MAKARTAASSSEFAPCLSPASFRKPYFVESSAWIEHSPFAFWITSVLKPRSFVELGTHSGFSYFTFCQAVQTDGLETKCFAVDTWKGDEHAGSYGEDVFEHVNSYNNKYYSTISRLVRSTFEEALPHFSDSSIDLLHIDGRHYYEDVKYDFESWRPKLSDRAVVLFHDTNVRERGFGVFQLWAELANTFPTFEFFHGHGLGVLGYGVELPQEIISLCTSQADCAVAIRTAYSRLGQSIQSNFDVHITQLKLENSEKVASGLRTELEIRNSEVAKLGNDLLALRQEYAAVKNRNEAIEADLVGLRQQHAAVKNRNEAIEADLVGLRQQHAAVKNRNEAIEANLVGLRQQHAALESRMTSELALSLENLSVRNSEIITLSNELASARRSIGELELRLEDSIQQVKALYTSSSWKFTRPLRALKRGAAYLRRKAAGLLAAPPTP